MSMNWFPSGGSVSATVQAKYWNYSGNPTTTAITTTAQQLLPAVTTPRAISYSATGAEGTIIKIWVNCDPLTDPPTLRSFPGHNAFDWLISGSLHVATESGTASVTIDTATEQTA